MLPGDRFIIRMFSPVVTIGGGTVVDISGHRYRREEGAASRLEVLAEGTAEQRLRLLVRESRYGLGVSDLIARTGLLASEIEQAAQSERLVLFQQPQVWAVDREWARATLARLAEVLHAFHQQNPLLPGMPKQELRSRELPGAPPFLLDALINTGVGIASEGEIVRLATHKLVLKQDEERALEAIERAFLQAGLAAPSLNDALAKSGLEPARARSLLQILLRQNRLVKIGDELVFHHTAIRGIAPAAGAAQRRARHR